MSFSLNGIASGLDTGTIISQLMQLERIPYKKLETKKNTINSELSIFRSINTKLSALRTAAQDLTLSSNFNIRSAKVSDESVLKVTANDSAQMGNYQISVTQLAQRHSIQSTPFVATGTDIAVLNEVVINGKTYELGLGEDDNNETALKKLMDTINADKDATVNASLIRTGNNKVTLVLSAKEAGEANKIEGNHSSIFNFTSATEAQDAKLTINGVEVTSSSNQLDDVLPGLSLTLMKVGDTTVDIAKDVDKIAEKIDAFVKAYNDVINTIRSNNSEGKNLQGDSTLRSLQSHLFNIFTRGVKVGEENVDEENVDEENKVDVIKYMFDIGLEIDKGLTKGSDMTGTISFDKEKFQAALRENPEEVISLFTYQDTSDKKEHGIARLFQNSLMDWTRSGSGIIASRIEGYNSEITFITKQMEDMDARLLMKEDQLKRQFTAMETALIQLQNQQSWMMSQIASMGIGI